jgi:predicted  nucleic acid-binding Zn-ribbon protein
MSSALQDIAETLATDFRDAVIDAEKADVEMIDKIITDLNHAFNEFTTREGTLDTKAEQAVQTLKEISDLRDVNATTYHRRVQELRTQLAEFRETKIAAKAQDPANVVRLESKA